MNSVSWEHWGIKAINKITGLNHALPSFWEALGLFS